MVALVLAVALLTPSVVARSASGRSGDPFAEFASHVAGAVRWASSGLASVAEAVVERPVVFLRGHHQLRKRLPAGGAAAGLSVVASARRASAAAGSGTDSGIDPAAVTTLAGNGTNQTVDGTGAAASFRDMGGVVYVGGYAYVATNGSIRKVDVISGAVTTLAGDPSATGCTDSASPSAVRFKQIVDIATDGTSLYATHLDCAAGTNFVIRKVAVATGATSTLSTIAHTGYVTYTGGYLFVSGTSTLKINVAVTPDTVSTIANLGANVRGIVGDGTYLWISTGNSSGSALKRVALSDGTVTTVASTSDGTMGTNAIEATGGALYLAINSGSSLWLRRYTESSGTWTTVAGAALGYADGTGTNALFSGMTGIGSDGNALYIADSGNHRLRKAVPTVSMTDPAIDLGAVSTAASGLSGLGDVVVLGRYAYFGTSGAVRKMDVASGAVTTVAGNGTSGSCVDSSDPTAVRFDHVKGIATDGMYLYVSGACGFDSGRIRKVSLATGATSTLTSQLSVLNSGALVYAGGYLFAGGRVINKINVAVSPDTNTTFVDLVSPTGYAGITGDGSYLYEAYNDGNAHGHLVRIALADASVLEIPTVGDVSFGAVRAAGSSLYVSTLSSNGDPTVRQYDEADGSYVTVAGAGPGFADGTASDAWFSNNVTGIASDTTALYVADAGAVAGDGRLRKILEGSPLPAAMPATNTKTVSIGPGKVSPFAGNSTQLNVDGTGTAASFSTLDSVVVVDGDAYVTSASAIRKVSLATGAVSPFAGSYSASGWVDSANPSDVRFNRLYEMATDGHYLYVADRPDPGYGRLRRVSLATGATSTVCSCLPGGVGSMAVGPDGVLYVLNGSGGAATIYQLDKPTGTMQVVVVVPTGAARAVPVWDWRSIATHCS